MVEGLACQCERVRSTGCPTLLEEEEKEEKKKEEEDLLGQKRRNCKTHGEERKGQEN